MKGAAQGARRLTLGATAAVALAVLPILGLGLAWVAPPALFAPPPLSMERLLPLVLRTLALALVVATGSALIGTWIAWVGAMTTYRGRRWLVLASLLPLAVPSYVLATVTREVLAPEGAIGKLLGLQGAATGFWPAALVLTLACAPYVQLIVGATLARIPAAELEAARGLGASPWRRFQAVLLPRLRPAWALSSLIVILYVVADFGAVAILDCEVLTWELYKASGSRDAVVIAFATMACVIPLVAGVRLLHGKTVDEVGALRAPLPRRALSGKEHALTWSLHGVLIGWGALLPTVMLTAWVIGGIRHNVTFAPLAASAGWTALYATLGATVTVAIAMAPAWLSARGKGRMAAWVSHGVHLTSSLPGVLVGVGLLHLILALKRHAPIGELGLWSGMEAAGVFLILAYAMRFLAMAHDALEPVLTRLDPRLSEAARGLGATSGRRLREVELPQILPGVRAAWILIFLAIAKELPLTLLLTPLGQHTLAYRLFDAQQEGSTPDVGLAGLMLLALAGVMFALVHLNPRGRHDHA
ncbi:MAG: ABC transporter permease [Myxococcota bacterium]